MYGFGPPEIRNHPGNFRIEWVQISEIQLFAKL